MPDRPARIVLKLLKPANLIPSFEEAWKLQLRNIYYIGGRDVREDGFEMDINYRIEGQEPRNDYEGFNLLRLFGLDKFNASKAPQPDGAFDFLVNRTIIPGTGEIIFPVLQPFGKNMPQVLQDAGLQFQQIYDTLKSAACKK
jgi:cell surface protein SprA